MPLKETVRVALRPQLRSPHRWARAHPIVTRAAKVRLWTDAADKEQRLVERVDPVVSRHDSMASGGCRHYLAVGSDPGLGIDEALAVHGASLRSSEWMQRAVSRTGLSDTHFGEQAWESHHDGYGPPLPG